MPRIEELVWSAITKDPDMIDVMRMRYPSLMKYSEQADFWTTDNGTLPIFVSTNVTWLLVELVNLMNLSTVNTLETQQKAFTIEVSTVGLNGLKIHQMVLILGVHYR